MPAARVFEYPYPFLYVANLVLFANGFLIHHLAIVIHLN